MTGILKTYTKDDIHSKREEKDKKHIDSYNPSSSSRELNPYWKDGGSGLPQTPENFRQSMKFLKPADDDDEDYYTKSNGRQSSSYSQKDRSTRFIKPREDDEHYITNSRSDRSKDNNDEKLRKNADDDYYRKTSSNFSSASKIIKKCGHDDHHKYGNERSYKWKKSDTSTKPEKINTCDDQKQVIREHKEQEAKISPKTDQKQTDQENKYLSDEKMNKLAAKIVKAEIIGDTILVNELKNKLDAAREYRKQNPDSKPDEDNAKEEGIMLIATNSSGNSRPLTSSKGDARSKGGKRKVDTHMSGERAKYFGNDDKYNLAQMVSNFDNLINFIIYLMYLVFY